MDRFHQDEQFRLTNDLRTGNSRDASQVLSQLAFDHDPLALTIIRNAKAMAGPGRIDDVLVDRFGDVTLVDKLHRTSQPEGRIPMPRPRVGIDIHIR